MITTMMAGYGFGMASPHGVAGTVNGGAGAVGSVFNMIAHPLQTMDNALSLNTPAGAANLGFSISSLAVKYNNADIPSKTYMGGYALGFSVTSYALPKAISSLEIPVYRVYGGTSKLNGASWTPINPKLFPTMVYRDLAGLPKSNTATHFIKGSVQPKNIFKVRRALPLDGARGGLPEFLIHPTKINYRYKPKLYESYWGY